MDSNDRSIVLSKNWKKRQLEELNIIKNEMVKNNVSEDLIQKYIDFLIKNKTFLEKQGVKPDVINEYVNLEYDKITKMFI